ncbi:hypothetical protein CABS01_06812 [Colletotrichum abscissum]|uniref:uncharacterized protein n=1 Tax=Colletotrichum abscissum TaxID=1671311 RepID=UPI0027D60B65|nr:uncharacterized protein CABS01_06812 [Colletotrichum abscissum]KAK1514833.1 hypothetical protein CABS01_06812 [Colletotrichum abscissum]
MQCPPAVRPSRPSRHPTEFLTASLLPPLNDSRAPSPTSSNPGPTCAGRPCRFGPGVSETTPVQCHARAVIGGVALERNTSTAVRVRQSRLKAQATQGGYVPRQIVAEVPNLPTTSCSGGLPIDENRLFSSLLSRMRQRLRPQRRDPVRLRQSLACCALFLARSPLATRSRSRSARGRDSDGERTTVPATLGASPPRGDYSFSPPVPPEPPLPGSEHGSGG